MNCQRLRHTFSRRLAENGLFVDSLAKLLGHWHLSSTQVYAHIYDETLLQQFKEAMSRLEPVAVDEWSHVETGERPLIEVELAEMPDCRSKGV